MATAEVPLIAAEGVVEAAKAALASFPTAQQAAFDYVGVAVAEMETHQSGTFFWHQPMWFVLRDLGAVASLLLVDPSIALGIALLLDRKVD